jgi:3-hydroxy-9,10-secoandrosta-1,3,5(10)-triene-9,17-dione monooxygenase
VSADVSAGLASLARELAPKLLEQAAETEERTYYSEELHRDFLDAGFYRMLVPKRYGGLEVDLPTFMRVITELGRGDASTAWCVCLSAGHALQVAVLFDEAEQEEIFGNGDFRCPAVAAPTVTATRADGGWELTGTVPYCSGAPYATHFLGHALAPSDDSETPPELLLFIAPRHDWEMLDDWGRLLGLKGSGSQSIRFDRAFVPDRFVVPGVSMVEIDVSNGTPGQWLHENPIYGGRSASFFEAELAAVMIGAAGAAVDEYETFVRTKPTARPPIGPRHLDPDYQRWLGAAIGRVEAADCILTECTEEYMAICARSAAGGEPFSREEDMRLNMVAREAFKLAHSVIHDIVVHTAGSSAMLTGARIERVLRDSIMAWGHLASVVEDTIARELARERLGVSIGQ